MGQPEARCMSEVLPAPRDTGWAPESGSDLEYSMSQVLCLPLPPAAGVRRRRCFGWFLGAGSPPRPRSGACSACFLQ